MKTNPNRARGRWLTVVVFAIAMAWVESAVVYYLRTLIHRIEPYQPDPLPIFGGLGRVEFIREAATMVMLFAVGMLAGRTWRQRIGYSAIAFGVWDIFYYVFLKFICGWPNSLLDWDILFLIPLPWWGPVLAPMLISLLMIAWGTLATHAEETPASPRAITAVWAIAAAGMVLALRIFMADAMRVAGGGVEAMRNLLPERFDWPMFLVALTLMTAPVAAGVWRRWLAPQAFSEAESPTLAPKEQI
jgi:hypothetical protein